MCALAPAARIDARVDFIEEVGLDISEGDGEIPNADTLARGVQNGEAIVWAARRAEGGILPHALAGNHEALAGAPMRVRDVAMHMATEEFEHTALVERLATWLLCRKVEHGGRG